jgi:hypothetical protein
MVARPSLVNLAALFVAVAAIVGLLPLVADLLWGPVIAHPFPSQSERVLGGIRDFLLCSSLLLAYLMWLQRRAVAVPLSLAAMGIAGLTVLSPLLNLGRYMYPNPVFDPVSSALESAFPWVFLAALLLHPTVRAGFGEPVRIRFSVRWFLIVVAAHVALFVTATSMISVSPSPPETFLTLPGRLFVGLLIRFGAASWLLDSSSSSLVLPLIELFGSALVWGCVFAFICPRIWASGRKPSNQSLQPTAGRSDA